MILDLKNFLAVGVAAVTLALSAGQAAANDFQSGISMVNGKMNNSAVQMAASPKIGAIGDNVIKQVTKDPIKPIDGVIKSPVNNVGSVIAKFRNDGVSSKNDLKIR